MDNAFRPDAPVLYFKQNFQMAPGRRRHILWPVWVYRVLAPEVKPRQLNVLQTAVLGMRRAGLVEAERIGEKLDIDPQLAAFIVVELLDKGLLDRHGLPTPAGVQALEEEAFDSGQVVTGHVFQDPWSGELWPRFVEQLSFAQVEFKPKRSPDLILGSVGRPRREQTYMHLPDGIAMPSPPEAAAILEACRWHRRAIRGFEPGLNDDGDEHATLPASPVRLERISLIDEQPQACFVVTTMYLPKDDRVQSEWFVTDPFGLRENASLRRTVERQLASQTDLRRVVETLVGQSLEDHRGKQLAWMAAVRSQAEAVVERTLSIDSRRLGYFDGLINMASAIQQANLLGEDSPEDLRRNVLTGARRVLEAMFGALATRHPLYGVWKPLYVGDIPNSDRTFVRQAYETAMATLGFAGQLPSALATVKPNQLRAACGGGDNWRLRPMIVATLLAACKQGGHPLKRVAGVAPTFLSDLDFVVGAAGEATHAGGECPALGTCAELVRKVYEAVALVEDLPFEDVSTEAVEN